MNNLELAVRSKLMRSLHLTKAAVFRMRDGSYIATVGDVILRGRNAMELLNNAGACDVSLVSEAIHQATRPSVSVPLEVIEDFENTVPACIAMKKFSDEVFKGK